MYLKELTLKGFKSFASATTLRFEPGITAVVGPNGSGKSNIVDALAWVMGEQGAKSLRGSSMEDVIFAGTSSRPPLGRAQVTLTIDNSDHALDIDYTEVTISRTIYRNGGSEYAINGSACRLLDIQDLLSDTGLGQQMHVIVGQGRLDEILRADPSGHRAFIEEAAGILKHRKRKERALRKLSNTETNLSRLDDLIGEIHRQLGPLGRQAKVSRRADKIQVSLRDAQARIDAEDALKSKEGLVSVRQEMGSVRQDLTSRQRDLARVKLKIEQAESVSSRSNPEMERINQVWHDLTQLQERFRSMASLADERARSLQGRIIDHPGDDPEILRKRAKELEDQAEAQETQVSNARIALDKAVQSRADQEKQLAALRQTLTELRQNARRRDARLGDLRQMVAKEESALDLAQRRTDDFDQQEVGLVKEQDQARQRLDLLEEESREPAQEDPQGIESAQEAKSKARQELDALEEQQRLLDARIISLKAKADALTDTIESRSASDKLTGQDDLVSLGSVTDFIQVEEGWEEPLAHALRDYAGAIVVDGPDTLLKALDRARDDRLGRAALLVPSDVVQDDAIQKGAGEGEGHRSAASLVGPRKAVSEGESRQADRVLAAIRLLLAGTAAVEDGRAALEALETGDWDQAVTRDGDLFDRVGAVGGSSPATSDLALVARRDKALAESEGLVRESEALTPKVEEARKTLDLAIRQVEEARNRQTEARLKAEQSARALEGARTQAAQVKARLQDLRERRDQAQEQIHMHTLKLEDLKSSLAKAEANGDDQVDLDDMDRRSGELEGALDQARSREMEARLTWKEADRKAGSLTRQAELLMDQANQAQQRRERQQKENELRRQEVGTLRGISSQSMLLSGLVTKSMEAATQERERLQERVSAQDQELIGLRKERDGLEPEVAALQEREHTLDLNRERLATEDGQLRQRIHDDLGMEVDELIREYGPDRPVPVLDDEGNPVPLDADGADSDSSPESVTDARLCKTVPYVRAEQVKRLEKAKRDLAALGKVNPLATEEYDALQTRNRYLNEQRNDVVKSRDDLMGLVKDLDKTMVQVFKEAFDDTAEAFERMFGTLFPGGTGRLRLENPDDLLTTGVLVEASPAGKKVRQLSLLSGGERSLTALALLFAIFTARPSPFYVMDEVEAALDDVNLTRLIKAFNQLREHAQLIVITHQQRTMSIADSLYGITMRGDGVTSVISQKLDREQDEG